MDASHSRGSIHIHIIVLSNKLAVRIQEYLGTQYGNKWFDTEEL